MKILTEIIVVLIVIAIAFVTITYLIDINLMKNNKNVLFSTWGCDYTPSINDIDDKNNNDNGDSYTRLVMVDNRIYTDTGKESDITERCGNMDGEISSNVSENDIPNQNNQSNFSGKYGYQRIDEDTIELSIDGKWIVFKV